MRTPAVMIIGLVLAPCGLVLNLTCTVAPNWRQLSNQVNRPQDTVQHQGLWDICDERVTNQNKQCGIGGTDYFSNNIVQVARGVMITSLVVTGLGIALASLGVRCWQDEPVYMIAGAGGVVIFISGMLSLFPVSWYNNQMYTNITTKSDTQPVIDNAVTIQVDFALVLGYLGSCLEIIGGFSLGLSFVRGCKDCIQSKSKSPSSNMYFKQKSPTNVYSIRTNQEGLGYSVGNDNYQRGTGNRYAPSVVSSPRSYTNPMDVTQGEQSRGPGRPASHLSSLPCDSDLL